MQDLRFNDLGIQMIPQDLRDQLFGSETNELSRIESHSIKSYLKDFNLGIEATQKPYLENLPELPPITGNNIVEHLDSIAHQRFDTLKQKLITFTSGQIPDMPEDYIKQPYWTRYTEGKEERVDHPLEDVFVIDTETFVQYKNYPVMASAASNEAFYIWIHPCLVRNSESYFKPELISVGEGKLIVNHNVKFDTAHFRETYTLFPQNPNYYFDTMSAHIAVCGMSTKQRISYLEYKKGNANYSHQWAKETSPNNLVDCYNLHYKPIRKLTETDKLTREIFVKSNSYTAFRNDLDELLEYNCLDITYTFRLAKALVPKYFQKKPNIITFGAHLGINQAILPVVNNWDEWLANTEQTWNLTNNNLADKLRKLALAKVKDFKDLYAELGDDVMNTINRDPWLSKLDWKLAKTGKAKGEPAWWRKVKDKKITTKSRLTPYLLELKWKDQPVEFITRKGWCFETTPDDNRAFRVGEKFYAKIPHPKGDQQNCGNPLGKSYIPHMESGLLTSSNPDANDFLETARSLSYWAIYRSRVFSYRAEQANDLDCKLIEPMLVVHGTASNRSVEKTWLTASKTNKKIIGSELKAKISAPKGYKLLGADMDSQEVKIGAAFSDAYKSLQHGSTPMAWVTLFGEKDKGTDAHTLVTKLLGLDPEIYRDKVGKPLNFSMIYFSGIKACTETIRTARPDLTLEEAQEMAKKAIDSRRGVKKYKGKSYTFEGGTDSNCYNLMLAIADCGVIPDHVRHLKHETPQTPALNSGMSDAITVANCGKDYLTSRANWGIQSSGVDLMHIFRVTLDYLFEHYQVNGRWIWNIHDEYWSLVADSDIQKASWCYQVAHLFTWAYFFKKMGFDDLPYNYMWFSSLNVDTVIRKEVYMDTITPSNPENEPYGLSVKIEDLQGLKL